MTRCYNLATEARDKGIDPEKEVETAIAEDVAARVEGLIGPKNIAQYIRDCEKKGMERAKISFLIAEEIASGRIPIEREGQIITDEETRADQALRSSLALLTEGVTAAPIEGIAKVKIRTYGAQKWLAVYYAGPIRAAGGTATGLSVLLADVIRKAIGIEQYIPTDSEIERALEEIELYDAIVHLQLSVTNQQLKHTLRNTPIEVTGEPTEREEVVGNRDLPRLETNKVRGGSCQVINDGLTGRAKKILKYVKELKIGGWDWLQEYPKEDENSIEAVKEEVGNQSEDSKDKKESNELMGRQKILQKSPPNPGYARDVLAGRPVFSHPSAVGGWRIRYGRSRATGLAGIGIHPAANAILDDFVVCGTHVRTERPGKGSVVMPVDSIEPPIVLLKNQEVRKLLSYSEALELREEIQKILFLGDMLIGYGEFVQNNQILVPSGYCEEWWEYDLRDSIAKEPLTTQEEEVFLEMGIEIKSNGKKQFQKIILELFDATIFQKVKQILKDRKIPLHPQFTYHWHDLTAKEIIDLREYYRQEKREDIMETSLDVSYIKKILEKLCFPHRFENGRIVSEWEDVLKTNLGLTAMGTGGSSRDTQKALQKIKRVGSLSDTLLAENEKKDHNRSKDNGERESEYEDPMEVINLLSPISIRTKVPVYTGARMGRPEKASHRAMKPPVNGLFPIGTFGGMQRKLEKAVGKNRISIEIAENQCPRCGKTTELSFCPTCDIKTVPYGTCIRCGSHSNAEACPNCQNKIVLYKKKSVDIRQKVSLVERKLGYPIRWDVKLVKGLTSARKIPEELMKGILRAKYKLYVYRDGTCRFDSVNVVLTHFKAREIEITVQQLIELGYTHDIEGEEITSVDQIIEIKPLDIIVNKDGARYLLEGTKYIDELLTRLYGMDPYYDCGEVQDIIGHLVVGLAPHTSAGTIARVIGFTEAKVGFAHPYWHAAKRRNCDGDEDSVILLLDVLLNFSKAYLPQTRGGSMDAPLVLITNINPKEVDDEAHQVDVAWSYPANFYKYTQEMRHSKEILEEMELISKRLGTAEAYHDIGYTHDVSTIVLGHLTTNYKRLRAINDKVNSQLALAERIKAVSEDEVASRIITTHLIPDIMGNLRRYGAQSFRCGRCNRKYRRIPLSMKCLNKRCDNGKLLQTIAERSVVKYMPLAERLAEKYDVGEYLREKIKLLRISVDTSFTLDDTDKSRKDKGKDKYKNAKLSLSAFFPSKKEEVTS